MSNVVKKKWTISNDVNSENVNQLASDINVPKSIAKTVNATLMTGQPKNHIRYFEPLILSLLKGMESFAKNCRCNNKQRKILIFGDYDVDGTSGVSMFHVFCANLAFPTKFIFLIGYRWLRLSNTGVILPQARIKLIVTIDCGITAVDKVEYAARLG
jgi:single-stranded-DNA-specific exonuclease